MSRPTAYHAGCRQYSRCFLQMAGWLHLFAIPGSHCRWIYGYHQQRLLFYDWHHKSFCGRCWSGSGIATRSIVMSGWNFPDRCIFNRRKLSMAGPEQWFFISRFVTRDIFIDGDKCLRNRNGWNTSTIRVRFVFTWPGTWCQLVPGRNLCFLFSRDGSELFMAGFKYSRFTCRQPTRNIFTSNIRSMHCCLWYSCCDYR